MMQQISAFHLESWILFDDLAFHLKLYDGHRLVHLDIQEHLRLTVIRLSL